MPIRTKEAARQWRREQDSIISRLRTLAEMTLWAELDSGASIDVGDKVRYLFKVYECTQAHTKALTRRPTNSTYWAEITI